MAGCRSSVSTLPHHVLATVKSVTYGAYSAGPGDQFIANLLSAYPLGCVAPVFLYVRKAMHRQKQTCRKAGTQSLRVFVSSAFSEGPKDRRASEVACGRERWCVITLVFCTNRGFCAPRITSLDLVKL